MSIRQLTVLEQKRRRLMDLNLWDHFSKMAVFKQAILWGPLNRNTDYEIQELSLARESTAPSIPITMTIKHTVLFP